MSDAHAVVEDHYEPALETVFNGKLAMWLFLCSEVMFFSGLIGAYMALRIGHPENFEGSQALLHNHVPLAAVNTGLLITSSLTMAFAVLFGQRKNRSKQRLFLVLTAVLGIMFLCVKAYEYNEKFENVTKVVKTAKSGNKKIVEVEDPLVPSHDLFFAFYWTLTGVHAVHIIAGIIPILGLALLAGKHDVSCETEMVGLYWHFVDLAWIFLFPLLYLI
jgi:cytochrome c oxidase subunit 3